MTNSLIALWPSYLAFLTSFVTILVIWVHHHWIFGFIRKNDHRFLYWNGLLLLFVTFVPFPTALLAKYLLHPKARVAANLNTGTILAISLAFDALWRHASRRVPSSLETIPKTHEVAQIKKQYRFGPPLYFCAFVVSFVSEAWSIGMCLLIALFFAIRGASPNK